MVGVIGSGNFGTTIATMLASNVDVLLYCRQAETAEQINQTHRHLGHPLPANILATTSPDQICKECHLLFPVLPSAVFRQVIRAFAVHLFPYHILIHGTKGFDVWDPDTSEDASVVDSSRIRTISQVIGEESQVVRIGCISGPNLSSEIRAGLPAAAIIASEFDEVIMLGHSVLNSEQFKIFGSHDLLGTELGGALKNMIAVGTGMIAGLQLGKNVEALFITRGLREMVIIGKALGATADTFFGIAGLGDLIATSASPASRNYNFGRRIALGESQAEIEQSSDDLAEGVRTIRLIHLMATKIKLEVPVIDMLYAIIFQGMPISEAISYLLNYPYPPDMSY